jgi:molecular chaperone GrpE
MQLPRTPNKRKKENKSVKYNDKVVQVLKNQLVRALADYDNLRKRVETERETWIRFSSERILVKIIPVLDAFESAQEHLKDQGLAIAINEFKKVLEEEGIEEIRPKVGDDFDEKYHEVVEVVEGKDKNKIAELILVGWKFEAFGSEDPLARREGRIIRFAKVKVFSGSK